MAAREVSTRTVVTGAVALAAALAAVWLLWQVAHVLLVIFAGTLLAVIWRNLGLRIAALSGLSDRLGTMVAIALTFLAVIGFAWSVGPLVSSQLDRLLEDLPRTVSQIEEAMRQSGWGRWLIERALPSVGDNAGSSDILGRVTGMFSMALGAAGSLVVVLMVAIYTAVAPHSYRSGFIELFPHRRRHRVEEVLHRLNQGLWHWLLGQTVAMIGVGLATTAGLWLLGIPLALVLGLIAGLLNFIPLLGPIISAIPALLVAFAQSPMDALYVGLLFLGIQQLEGNVLTPLIQREAVHLPPAVILASVIIFGVLFGALGALLATPLAVLTTVLVKLIYVENVLGDTATHLP